MKVLTNEPKKYRGAIFDLDGTLLNTIDDLADSVNESLAALGHPTHTVAAIQQMVGNGFRNLLTRALPEDHRSDAEIDGAVRLFDEAYSRNYLKKTAPYEGILALVAVLDARGIGLGVNSNKRDDYTKDLIAKWFPHVSFAGVYGERETEGIPKKPHPAAALAIARDMGLTPEEVLFVGDSRPDIRTGHNAGMDCAGVTWGFRTPEDLEENGADYLIDTAEELLTLF